MFNKIQFYIYTKLINLFLRNGKIYCFYCFTQKRNKVEMKLRK